MLYNSTCGPVAGVDEHVGGAKTGNGIHRSQLVSGCFLKFSKAGDSKLLDQQVTLTRIRNMSAVAGRNRT